MKTKPTPTAVALLGAINLEALGHPTYCAFPDHHASFRVSPDGPDEAIHYTGKDQLQWGGKATAVGDLSSYGRRGDFTQQTGGGIRNTGLHLASLGRFTDIEAYDTAEGGEERVETELADRGIRHVPLDLHPLGTNVVLARGGAHPARVCLTSPVAEAAAPIGDIAFPLLRRGGLAVINSCKSLDLTRRFSDAALAAGLTQYSVVNRALNPKGARLTLRLARDAGSMCNLAEFAELVEGDDCTKLAEDDRDERTANLERVAQSLAAFARIQATGDLVVTLGERGAMVCDRSTGLIAHVALTPARLREVRAILRRDPVRVSGSGDRLFGGFVAGHSQFRGDPRTESRALRATLEASAGVIDTYGSALGATRKWFDVRIFAERFVA